MEKSKLVCTPDDMVNLSEKLQKIDIVDHCTKERDNTKRTIYKFTNVSVFALLLKDIPMSSKDTVLLEPVLMNQNVNCLTFERNRRHSYNDNLCLYRALALHLQGNDKLDQGTSKSFNLFLFNCEKRALSRFQVVHMNEIPKNEDLLQLKIFRYDFDFVDEKHIRELACPSTQ